MLELICYQTYDTWGGLPVDRSPYGLSSGVNVGAVASADGVSVGSGSLHFGPHSRVSIPGGGAWKSLGALRVEVVARLEPVPPGFPLEFLRFFVLGGSFSFAALKLNDGLFGTIFGADGEPAATVTSGAPDSPDGQLHPVPIGSWATFGFSYDGFSTMQLTIDGELVGQKQANVPILPVGDEGVMIGGSSGFESPFFGDIDEIKIWRDDPGWINDVFLSRPCDDGLAECWLSIFTAVGTALREHPDQLGSLVRAAQGIVDAQLGVAAATGPDALAELGGIYRRYTGLWCQGALDTDAMESVFRDFFAWWRGHTQMDPTADADARAVVDEIDRMVGGMVQFGCDPSCRASSRGSCARPRRKVSNGTDPRADHPGP